MSNDDIIPGWEPIEFDSVESYRVTLFEMDVIPGPKAAYLVCVADTCGHDGTRYVGPFSSPAAAAVWAISEGYVPDDWEDGDPHPFDITIKETQQ